MQQIIYTCDRCKKQFAYKNHIDATWSKTYARGFSVEHIKLDLCSDCMDALYAFLYGPPTVSKITFPKDNGSGKDESHNYTTASTKRCLRGKADNYMCEYRSANGDCHGVCYPTNPPQYDKCVSLTYTKGTAV